MATETLEDRLALVENELAQLKHMVAANKSPDAPAWWDKMFGSFAESEGFEEAVRLGKDYRESLRPRNDERNA